MRNIGKSLSLMGDLFPKYYLEDKGQRPYHFAFLFKKNSLISFGVNGYKQDAKILYLGQRFSIEKYKKYRVPHAETDAISKAWGKTRLDNRCMIVTLRTNRFGRLQNSKPCKDCQTVLDSLGITKRWWSTRANKVTDGKIFLSINNEGDLIYE